MFQPRCSRRTSVRWYFSLRHVIELSGGPNVLGCLLYWVFFAAFSNLESVCEEMCHVLPRKCHEIPLIHFVPTFLFFRPSNLLPLLTPQLVHH